MGKDTRWSLTDLLKKGFSVDSDGSYAKDVNKLIPENNFQTVRTESKKSVVYIGAHAPDEIEFLITPIGKPRMTRRDKWLNPPRKPVLLYRQTKDALLLLAAKANYTMPECGYHVIAILPMPPSWTEDKKNQMRNTPHKQKPDKDNIEKFLLDSFFEDDSSVWDGRVTKYWGNYGKIIIKKIPLP